MTLYYLLQLLYRPLSRHLLCVDKPFCHKLTSYYDLPLIMITPYYYQNPDQNPTFFTLTLTLYRSLCFDADSWY